MKKHVVGIFVSIAFVAACGESSDPIVPAEGPTAVATVRERLSPSSTYSARVLADGPVSYWRLGERPGTTVFQDELGAQSGTLLGSPTLNSPGALVGESNGAVFLNYRTRDYINVPEHLNQAMQSATGGNTPNHLTLEVWLTAPGAEQTYSAPISKTTGDYNDGYGIYYFPTTANAPSTINFYVGSRLNALSVPFKLETPRDRFHHVVGTYDQQNLRLYIDGVLKGGPKPLTSPVVVNHGPLYIGRGKDTTLQWSGKLDEVAIYNKALSADAVAAHYKLGIGADPIADATSGDPCYGGVILGPLDTNPNPGPTNNYAIAACDGSSPCLDRAIADLKTYVHRMVPSCTLRDDLHTTAGESIQLIRTPGYTPQPNTSEGPLLAELATRDLLAFAALSDSTSSGLKIFAKSDYGLAQGVYAYLRLLGVRFVMPNAGNDDRWTFAPTRTSARWNVARVEEPVFKWGAQLYAAPTPLNLPSDSGVGIDGVWARWTARLGLRNGLAPGGQSGHDFNIKYSYANNPRDPNDTMGACSPTFGETAPAACAGRTFPSSHPEWRARKPDANGVLTPVPFGSSSVPGNFHWQIAGNTAFQTFYAAARVDALLHGDTKIPGDSTNARIDPLSLCASAEQIDGASDDQTPGASTAEDPYILAAATANAIAANSLTQGRYASVMAYSEHAQVPNTALPSNLIVNVAAYDAIVSPGAFRDDYLVTQWGKKITNGNLFVYAFWPSTAADTGDTQEWPVGLDYFEELPARVALWRANGISGIESQSIRGAGTDGLAWYLASQLATNPNILYDDVRDSTMDLAFGAAKPPMAKLLEGWARGYTNTLDEMALSMNDINAALGSTADPKATSRILDFAAYAHWLYLHIKSARGGTGAPTTADLVNYIWSIHDRAMLWSYFLARNLVNGPPPTAAVTRLGDADVRANLNRDRGELLVSNPNPVTPVVCSGAMTPYSSTPGPSTYVTTTEINTIERNFEFYAANGQSTLGFYLWALTGTAYTISVSRNQDGISTPVSSAVITNIQCPPSPTGTCWVGQGGVPYLTPAPGGSPPISFPTAQPGQYTVRIGSLKSQTYALAVLGSTPFVSDGAWSATGGVTQAFPASYSTVSQDTFFYVPPGTQRFALLRQGAGPCLNVYAPSAGTPSAWNAAPEPCAAGSEGYLNIEVNGRSGIWKLGPFGSNRGLDLIGVPDVFSPSVAQMMIPATPCE